MAIGDAVVIVIRVLIVVITIVVVVRILVVVLPVVIIILVLIVSIAVVIVIVVILIFVVVVPVIPAPAQTRLVLGLAVVVAPDVGHQSRAVRTYRVVVAVVLPVVAKEIPADSVIRRIDAHVNAVIESALDGGVLLNLEETRVEYRDVVVVTRDEVLLNGVTGSEFKQDHARSACCRREQVRMIDDRIPTNPHHGTAA